MVKKFKFITNTFVLFTIFILSGCKENKLDIDVSNIDVKLDIRHFEEDLFNNKITDYATAKQRYPYFIDDYTMGIIGFPGDSLAAFNQLMIFRNDQNAKKAYQMVHDKYRDFKPFEASLTNAYRHFKYFFPVAPIPVIVTYTGNFSYTMNPVGNDYIGIALDMHMGKDFKPYEYANIEMYWRKILIPETIVTNHMMAQANDMFAASNKKACLADEMIFYGKLLYFLDAMLPDVADEYKIGYTKQELEWCKQEEKNIWAFMVKEKYLYETEVRKYEKLINEGPKTILSGVPPDAPAMLGRYTGWMIVREYMKENPDVSLQELMQNSDAKGIIQMSAYKPD